MDKTIYFQKIYILFKKELMGYFNSPIAYIFIGAFLIIANWLFFNTFFIIEQANMRNYFILLPWIFLLLVPAITMRLWAEEKRTGTIEFLLTLPITDWQVVLAKFFGSLVFLAITLLLSISIPVTVVALGDVDVGPIIGGYVGAILMGAVYLALGLFVSSLTKNQIIGFILALSACFIFFMLGNDFIVSTAPQFLAPIFKFLGISSHFDNIARGVIDTKDVVYYGSFVWLFLWLNKEVVALRK